jgi:hypothetical protein
MLGRDRRMRKIACVQPAQGRLVLGTNAVSRRPCTPKRLRM